MKKVLLFSITLSLAASISSCKKDYTCTCYSTGTVVGSYPITNSTKASATTSCNNEAASINAAAGGTLNVNCSLN